MSVIEREQEQVQVGVDPTREGRARVLEAAALEIEVRGWTQNVTLDWRGRVCLMGAIAVPLDLLDSWDTSACGLIMDAWDDNWKTSLPHREGAVPKLAMWNDALGRTAGEVTFVLRWRAAEIRDGR